MIWSDEEIATLRVLWDEGLSVSQIGRRIGKTKNAVMGRVHRMKLSPRQSPIKRDGEPLESQRSIRVQAAPVAEALSDLLLPLSRKSVVLKAPPPKPATSTSPCCWPIGEPRTKGFRFCGDGSALGKPYCARHCKLAYVRIVRENAA